MLTKRFSTWTRIPTAKSVSKNSRKSLERGDQKPTSLISWPLTRLPSSKKNYSFSHLLLFCFGQICGVRLLSSKESYLKKNYQQAIVWSLTTHGNNILVGSFVTFYKIDFISMNRLSIMTRLYYDDKAKPSFSITLFQ